MVELMRCTNLFFTSVWRPVRYTTGNKHPIWEANTCMHHAPYQIPNHPQKTTNNKIVECGHMLGKGSNGVGGDWADSWPLEVVWDYRPTYPGQNTVPQGPLRALTERQMPTLGFG